mmetsp:Transcript_2389/g.5722  ORF Transcript_2389/g.5722 Transcript_2389/m.5722 type:complete len:285 (+) Transcript_2389:150-1004(+)
MVQGFFKKGALLPKSSTRGGTLLPVGVPGTALFPSVPFRSVCATGVFFALVSLAAHTRTRTETSARTQKNVPQFSWRDRRIASAIISSSVVSGSFCGCGGGAAAAALPVPVAAVLVVLWPAAAGWLPGGANPPGMPAPRVSISRRKFSMTAGSRIRVIICSIAAGLFLMLSMYWRIIGETLGSLRNISLNIGLCRTFSRAAGFLVTSDTMFRTIGSLISGAGKPPPIAPPIVPPVALLLLAFAPNPEGGRAARCCSRLASSDAPPTTALALVRRFHFSADAWSR